MMADNTCRTFKYSTKPLSNSKLLPPGTGAYYNSLFLKDADTVWLLVTRARYEGSDRKESSIEVFEGKVVPTR